MAKNKELLEALTALQPDTAIKEAQLKALDDLIHVDLEHKGAEDGATLFRNAVVANQKALTGAETTYEYEDVTSHAFLNPDDDGGETNNLRQIQRVAAEQRVKLGLAFADEVAKKTVYTALVTAVDDQALRVVLQNRADLFGDLKTSHHWDGIDENPAILSPDALVRIREDASKFLTVSTEEKVKALQNEINEKNASVTTTLEAIKGDPTLLDAHIIKATADLSFMQDKLKAIQAAMEADKAVLALPGNATAKGRIDTALTAASTQIEVAVATTAEKVAQLYEVAALKSTLVVNAFTGIANPTSAPTTTLTPALQIAEENYTKLTNALKLAAMGQEVVPAEVTENKNKAELSLLKLQIALHAKTAEEEFAKVRQLQSKMDGPPILEAQAAKAKLAEAEVLLVAIQKAREAAEKVANIRGGLIGFNSPEHQYMMAANDRAKKAFDDAEAILAVYRKKYAQPVIATHFVQKTGNMQYFTDELLRGKKFDADLPSSNAENAQNISLRASKGRAEYEGVALKNGEMIRSVANFPAHGDTPAQQGILIQDHTGKVTDMTKPGVVLTPEQKIQMAMKQAKMCLTHYDPSQGPILIEGQDVQQASVVLAALMHLRGKQKIEIKSLVVGLEIPKASTFQLQSTADKNFIKAHLPAAMISPDSLDTEKKQVGVFTRATASKREELKNLKDAAAGLEKKFQEGDKLEIDSENDTSSHTRPSQ